MELRNEPIKKSKLIYPYSAAITQTGGDHYFRPSNSHITRNHMLHKKNPHCSYRWDTIHSLSPLHIRRPMSLTHKSDYCYCKKHEKKPMLRMNSHDRTMKAKS